MSYQYINRAPLNIMTWAPPMGRALGSDELVAPTEKVASMPTDELTIVDDPMSIISKKDAALMSDDDLTNTLNEAIAEGWRIKGCNGPYCIVQADKNAAVRLVLLAEYRRRQMSRQMPDLKEPIHTLAYGRYKLSKNVISWANHSLTGRVLWPVRVYTKASATALEDIIGSEYLTAFIVSSPIVGVWFLRKLGYSGIGALVVGGYLGMLAGALLPFGLFSLSNALGAAEEKDYLWAAH